MSQEKIDKKIKRMIYGIPQNIAVIYPPGMLDIALNEIHQIFSSSWFPQKPQAVCEVIGKKIIIKNIHMITIMEVMLRAQCLTDIRLILYEGKAFGLQGIETKCNSIDWELFLNKNMLLKIKTNSIASKAFHESAISDLIANIIQDKVAGIVKGSHENETTCLYVDLIKNKVRISLSLAGKKLYKKGYRTILSASAPLREDIASCCVVKALQFAKQCDEILLPEKILIPFSGTGTFAFEFLLNYLHFSPVLLEREYAIQHMPFFREESFQYLIKKAQQQYQARIENLNSIPEIICVDSSEKANLELHNNLKNFKQKINSVSIQLVENDFFDFNLDEMLSKASHIFMLLNPPYGLRLGQSQNTLNLYKKIALKINEIFSFISKDQKSVFGCILCPTEEAWSVFLRYLGTAKTETHHFNQGGIDVRVCYFVKACS